LTGPIVLGYDESPSANAALAKTVELATALGASVVVVFGYYISPLGGGDVADFKAQLEKVGSHAVSRAVTDLEAAGIETTARIVSAKPADAILQVADEVGASLITVGTVGENPVTGAILGSVVLRLVQRSWIPLLVVPTDEPESA
jgi:nucleotide-binding universal stress UspA family protein